MCCVLCVWGEFWPHWHPLCRLLGAHVRTPIEITRCLPPISRYIYIVASWPSHTLYRQYQQSSRLWWGWGGWWPRVGETSWKYLATKKQHTLLNTVCICACVLVRSTPLRKASLWKTIFVGCWQSRFIFIQRRKVKQSRYLIYLIFRPFFTILLL